MNWHSVPLPPHALVVMLGAPGAGKSTAAALRFKPSQVLCLDRFRGMVCDDEGDQEATTSAVALLNHALSIRAARGLTTVIDATNAQEKVRRDLVHRVEGQLTPVAFHVLAPLSACIWRQESRERKVPSSVIRGIYDRLALVRPDQLEDEGFRLLVRAHPQGYYSWQGLGDG